MSKTTVECTIYIHGTPDDVWKGLLDPQLTRLYWMHEMVSDLETGSEWAHVSTDGDPFTRVGGTVLDNDMPRRLALSWARPEGEEYGPSKVLFEVSSQDGWPHGPWTGLRLEHSDLEEGSDMHESVAFGWPAVLSGLKSVVERRDIFG